MKSNPSMYLINISRINENKYISDNEIKNNNKINQNKIHFIFGSKATNWNNWF